MPEKKHKFGIVVFVQAGFTDDGMPVFPKNVSVGEPEKDDPFCYDCGQKLMNAGVNSECSGRSKHSTNPFVKDYSI